MISHKVREIWDNGAFWLAEMSSHMTWEWHLSDLQMMWLFAPMQTIKTTETNRKQNQLIEEIKSFPKLFVDWKSNHY